jgi:hypothetical protein
MGSRFNDPIEPMDLANMRENGVRSLAIYCHQCHHETVMNVDHLGGYDGAIVWAADGVHEVRDDRHRPRPSHPRSSRLGLAKRHFQKATGSRTSVRISASGYNIFGCLRFSEYTVKFNDL